MIAGCCTAVAIVICLCTYSGIQKETHKIHQVNKVNGTYKITNEKIHTTINEHSSSAPVTEEDRERSKQKTEELVSETEKIIEVAQDITTQLEYEQSDQDDVEDVPPHRYDDSYVFQTPNDVTNENPAGVYTITAYTWTGNTMANGEYPYYGSAASSDFSLGTVLYIEGVGKFVVNDVCPTSGVIDIYFDTYEACMNFGRVSADVYIQ